MKPSYIKNAFMKIIDSIESDPTPFVKRPGIDFSRNRKCSISTLIRFLLSMEATTLEKELKHFFKPSSIISKSALIQQRAKLNEEVFPYLFTQLNSLVPFKNTLNDYHPLAVDGSLSNIPFSSGDESTQISSNTPDVKYAQFLMCATYHLGDRRFTDLLIQPRGKADEREAFLTLLSRNSVPGKCIFIMDRGYESLNVLGHLQQSEHFFLLRMKTADTKPNLLSRFPLPKDAEFDTSVKLSVTRSKKKAYINDPEHYACIRRDRRFDLIDVDDRTSMFDISFRLVKVQLPGGDSEYLATNLPSDEFSIDDLRELYRLRWGIETAFRSLKYDAALTSFHSIRRDFIIQEIYARIILYNFAMMIINCTPVPQKEGKPVRRISVSDAIDTCRHFLIHRIKNAEIKALLCRNLVPDRPGRSYQRKVRAKRVVPLMYRA